MKRWLCSIGFHKWEFITEVYWVRFWRCSRCNRNVTT